MFIWNGLQQVSSPPFFVDLDCVLCGLKSLWKPVCEIPTLNESEWLTRKRRIDSKLKGMKPPWKIVKFINGMDISALDRCAIEELPDESYGHFVGSTNGLSIVRWHGQPSGAISSIALLVSRGNTSCVVLYSA